MPPIYFYIRVRAAICVGGAVCVEQGYWDVCIECASFTLMAKREGDNPDFFAGGCAVSQFLW